MKWILFLAAILISHKSFTQMKPSTLNNKKDIVCKLTTPELQQRKKIVIAELKNLILEKRETATGMKYKFEGSDNNIDLLTSFIKTERLCCDFFTFTLTVNDENNYAWLDLSGPEGTKEFIKTEIEF